MDVASVALFPENERFDFFAELFAIGGEVFPHGISRSKLVELAIGSGVAESSIFMLVQCYVAVDLDHVSLLCQCHCLPPCYRATSLRSVPCCIQGFRQTP